jgi:hypothetical protein
MDCKLTVEFNGKTVLDARCTRVVAYEILRHGAEDFVNPEKAGYVVPKLQRVYNAFPGEVFKAAYGDSTCTGSYVLEVLS